ncbi:right-handed parallel beta-helix repeat-containing protein [candidate division WOR-3 bacterium]|nr:right-handed parallel beta-helix repeat-containing protein [candidate division WOR-3 bacterium]
MVSKTKADGRFRTGWALGGCVLLLLSGCPSEDLTPPQVTMVAPAAGDSIAGATVIRARATDNKLVVRVDFYVDSVRVGADTAPVGNIYAWEWNPISLLPGSSHTLFCAASDAAGNRGHSPSVTVYVSQTAGTHHRGTLAQDQTWTAAGNPHVVDADLAVEAFLTIEPGVLILMAGDANIRVGARYPAGLVATGRPDSLVTITSLDTSRAWGGISFGAYSLSGSNLLSYTLIEKGGAGVPAMVMASAGRVALEHTVIRSSLASGVMATGEGLGLLAHTSISKCAGYPLAIPAPAVSSIGSGNRLTGNLVNAVRLAGGLVTATDTWPNLQLPYHITATVTVAGPSGPVLTIAPGCSLLFADSAGLRIGVTYPGGLRADGAYGRIAFLPLAAAPGPATWRGIEMYKRTNPGTALSHCLIQGAGAGSIAALYIDSVPVAITNTRISDCPTNGVYCLNTGFASFRHDTIADCAGYPLRISAQYVNSIGDGNDFAAGVGPHLPIQVSGGAITRDAQFRRQNVPYRVIGSIEVESPLEPTLVVGPGAVLQFDSGAALILGRTAPARIQASGGSDSITFTADLPLPGRWQGLRLHRYVSSASRLQGCRILYGGGDGRGILLLDECEPTVTDNEIAHSSNFCVYMVNTELEPDTIWARNWLHDWAVGYDSIYYEPPSPSRSGPRR